MKPTKCVPSYRQQGHRTSVSEISGRMTHCVQWAVCIAEVQMRQRVRTGQELEEKLQNTHTHTFIVNT